MELGKTLAEPIYTALEDTVLLADGDAATQALLEAIRRYRNQ